MNTQDMQDKNLDSLFRKAAETADFPFEEKSWDVLEKRLDFAVLMTRIIWLAIIGSLVILISIPVYLKYFDNSPQEGKNIISTRNEVNTSVPLTGLSAGDEKGTVDLPTTGATIASRDPVKKTDNVLKGEEKVVISRNEVVSGTGSNQSGNQITNDPPSVPSPFHVDNSLPYLKSAALPQEDGPDYPKGMIHKQTVIIDAGQRMVRPNSTLLLSFSLGPELNAVKLNESGMSMMEGIGLAYFPGRKIGFKTGLYHVKKNYAVKSGEYIVPDPGMIKYGKSPGGISVSCHVIDIPLNIYYSIWNSPHNRLFAGAGLSSYLMLTEEYSYEYGQVGNLHAAKLILRNQNQHYFGIMNLSVGYTKSIAGNLSWGIEPYVKIPLTGIAAAEVKLKSFGVLFSLNYRLH